MTSKQSVGSDIGRRNAQSLLHSQVALESDVGGKEDAD